MWRKITLGLLLLLGCFRVTHGQQQINERILYVPLKDWEKVLQKEPKGVRLSYQRYLELLRKQPPKRSVAPTRVIVNKVEYQGHIVDKMLHLDMHMEFSCLGENGGEFRFLFGSMGLEKALLDGRKALLLARPLLGISDRPQLGQKIQQVDNNAPFMPQAMVEYRLLLIAKGTHRLHLKFHKNLHQQRDELSANIVLGNFPRQIVYLKTKPDFEYIVNPKGHTKKQELCLYLGSKNNFFLQVRPREKKDVKQPLILGEIHASHLVKVDTISSLFKVALTVHHQPQKTFRLQLPKNVEIVSISENRWDIEEKDKSQILTIQLEKEITGVRNIVIKTEQQLLEDQNFSLPKLEILDDRLFRQTGIVYLEKSAEINLELLESKSVRQLSPYIFLPRKGWFKQQARPTQIHFFGHEPFVAFKFWDKQYHIKFKKKVIVPQMESTFVSAISLYQDGLECSTQITFDVIQGKVKELAMKLPTKWSLSSLQTYIATSGSRFHKIPVSNYYIKKGILHLPLRKKIVKGQRVKVALLLQYMPEKWQSEWKTRELKLPLVIPQDAKYLASFVGIIAEPDYKVEVSKMVEAMSVDLNIIRSLQISSRNLRLGLKLTKAKADVTLRLTRKKPHVTLMATTYIAVDPDRLRCSTVLVYNIKNASRNSFSFWLPQNFTQLLNISDEFSLIKEKRHRLTEKGHHWTVKLQKRVLGIYTLYLAYEVPIKKAHTRFYFPPLLADDIAQLKGFIGIAGTSQAEITISSQRLTSILSTQLPILAHPEFPKGANFLHTFKHAKSDIRLTLDIKMHGKVDVATAILKNINISTIYAQKNLERVICRYELAHLGMQFFNIRLPQDASLWSAVVDNKGEKPHKKNGIISIPVPRHNDGRANIIKVIYERKVRELGKFGKIKLERPQITQQIPIRKLHWQLHLPHKYQVGYAFRSYSKHYWPWYKIVAHLFRLRTRRPMCAKTNSPILPQTEMNKRVVHQAPRGSWQRKKKPRPKPSYPPRKARRYYKQKRRVARQRFFGKDKAVQKILPPQAPQEQLIKPAPDLEDSKPELSKEEKAESDSDDFDDFVEDEKKSSMEWKKTQEPQPIISGKKIVDGSKFTKLRDQTGVYSVKARGLRSLEFNLSTSFTKSGSRRVSPRKSLLSIRYIDQDVMRSIELACIAFAAIFGLLLLLQRRVSRLSLFLSLLLIFSFIPAWFGIWLVPYCNALVFGLFISIAMRLLYKIIMLGKPLFVAPAACICFLALSGISVEAQSYDVYVPYDSAKVKEISEPKSVFLPYQTYIRLWNNAYPDRPIEIKKEQGAPYCLYHARYQGHIVGEQIEFTATFMVAVERGPVVVPLGLSSTAVQKAFLYDQANRSKPLTLRPSKEGYSVIIAEPGEYRIQLQFIGQGQVNVKRGEVGFSIPDVAVSVLELTLDADLEVNLPNFDGSWYEKIVGEQKTVYAFPGLTNRVHLLWYQSSERYRAKGLNVAVDSKHSLFVGDNLLRLESRLNYSVISGKIDKLRLNIPKDYTILKLSCTNLERWIFSQDKKHNSLILRLSGSQQHNLVVNLLAEKKISKLPCQEFFPEIVPLDASRENGQAIVATHNAYNLIIDKHNNLRKISSHQQKNHFFELFRYTEHPFSLIFRVKPRKINNFASSFLTVKVDEEKIKTLWQHELQVRGKEIFQYQLNLPKNVKIDKVLGRRIKSWRANKNSKQTILDIVFQRSIKKGEKATLKIDFSFNHTGAKVLELPSIGAPLVNYHSGNMLVASSQDLDITIGETKGLEEYDIAAFPNLREFVKRYAFRFEGEEYAGKINLRAQIAELSTDTIINLLVEDDWINLGYFIRYKIKFAAIDHFKFRLPTKIGNKIDILGENIKERKKSQKGKYIIWEVILHNKVRNFYELAIFPDVFENQGTGIAVKGIEFPQHVNQRLAVLVQNESQYELIPQKVEGLSSISPAQSMFFPPRTSAHNFIMAYKMERVGWELTFAENKQKVVHTTRASIDNIKIDTVLDKQGECRHRIIYNLRHWGLQFLEIEKLDNIKIWGVFVAGIFIKPVKRDSGDGVERILIPLQHSIPSKTEEERLSVRMIYSQVFTPISKLEKFRLDLPRIRNVKEIGQVNWTLRLPGGYLYKFGGNISLGRRVPFSEYQVNLGSYRQQARKLLHINRKILKSNLSSANKLKMRQGQWLRENEKSQQRILNDIQDVRQQENRAQNFSNMQRVRQYGLKNLMDAQRAGSTIVRRKVYKDRKSNLLAGEANDRFFSRQAKKAQVQLSPGKHLKISGITNFTFDLDYSTDGNIYYFSKKQGEAQLEIRCYKDPRHSKLWSTVQFTGLFLLILLASLLKVFSLKDGYSLSKFGITIALLLATVFLFYFLDFVHYFYL